MFLERLIEPRNARAHSNPLSVRQAEQVICYSHDVIDAIKQHMEAINMAEDYNAPTIIKVTDSRGLVFHDSEMREDRTDLGRVSLTEDKSAWLRVGDTLSLEVEVDPSFSPDEYQIEWRYLNKKLDEAGATPQNRLLLEIREHHVSYLFVIDCVVISNKPWHRFGMFDDTISMSYRVLPPSA